MSLTSSLAQIAASEANPAPSSDYFHEAVNAFDLNAEFSNDAWYANQVDIYSD